MPRYWKQLLAPGSFTVRCVPCKGRGESDGEQCPFCAGAGVRTAEFTADDCRQLHETGKAMLSAGLKIPIPLEHQAGADPLAASVAFNSGFVGDYHLDDDGTLWGGLDIEAIPDPAGGSGVNDEASIRHRLEKTIRYVSPSI